METVRTVADLRARVARWRETGERIALVPTMGALHDGHLSLVTVGKAHAGRAVASIFVNPTQFGPNEDLASYPRDEARDAAMLEGVGCDLIFAPAADEMYPPGFSTRVLVDGLTDCLCGATRPGHFDGVAQIVAKLLNQARADVAVFGEKDWQQLAVLRRLARDLDTGTDILGAPVVREADGLAMSSRNRYLDAEQRAVAGQLNRVIRTASRRIAGGAPAGAEMRAAADALAEVGFNAVDYAECRHADDLTPVERFDPDRPARVFAAAHIGRARLIDNVPVDNVPVDNVPVDNVPVGGVPVGGGVMKALNLPPVWLAGFMALAWVLAQLWAPLGSLLVWPGWALIAAGIALTLWAVRAFRRARTTFVPHQPPEALVDTGPFRYSRNPIYLADLIILAGWVLVLGAPLGLVLLVPFRAVLLSQFILPEEAVLERDLGQPYLAFKARVRRWV